MNQQELQDRERMRQTPEIGKITGINPFTLRRWAKQGKLHCLRVGNKFYWHLPTVERELRQLMGLPEEEEPSPGLGQAEMRAAAEQFFRENARWNPVSRRMEVTPGRR